MASYRQVQARETLVVEVVVWVLQLAEGQVMVGFGEEKVDWL
jgi:hypothetical protein